MSITASPPVELSLQQGDGVFQRLVPLLLLLPLALPLLGRQLHIQADLVLDRLCPDRGTRDSERRPLLFILGSYDDGFGKSSPGVVPLPELQRGLGLGIVEGGRGAADHHGGPTVSSQRILQDPGHLTVPVWHIGLTEDK